MTAGGPRLRPSAASAARGGVIWSLTHFGVLWDEPLLAEAEFLVELLSALIERDEHFDLIAGAAGYISRLLCLHHCAPSGAVRAAARQCGDRLIARTRPMSRGIGWVTGLDSSLPLGSFSHGAAGTAWALLESAALTGEKRFREAALVAIDYERTLFVPEMGNWLDLGSWVLLRGTT